MRCAYPGYGLARHPASTTHRQLSPDELAQAV